MDKILFFVLLSSYIASGSALYCYRCTSTQPGCATPFNWQWRFWGESCPEDDDICVKIIERKGATEIITRECLSHVTGFRTDIPADHYEGCRPAATDVRLAHYVNNSIRELDIRRDFYDSTTWCFCFLDHRCNSADKSLSSVFLLMSAIVLFLLQRLT